MAKRPKTGGRTAGVPNKTTATMKAAIEQAFDHLESKGEGFNAWALKNETIFYTQLMPKLIPVQHTGDAENPIAFQEIGRRIIDPRDTDR